MGTLTLEQAAALLKTTPVRVQSDGRDVLEWASRHKPADLDMVSHLIGLAREARKRSKRAGYSTKPVSAEIVVALYYEGGGRCALSGIPFDLARPLGSVRRPFAPSLDRVDSSRGYHEKNVRLVCCAVNYLMNEWGDAVFHRLADALKKGQPC